jgi:D-alanyl-D-alanine carboxypeptidase/D-alanyl-D-alanine-endopeptidase (penicillin-binding protein 4)
MRTRAQRTAACKHLAQCLSVSLLFTLAGPAVAQEQGKPKPKLRPGGPAKFTKRVAQLLAEPAAAQANWGILIVDAESGQTLYALNAEKHFVPASNLKLFSTAFALARLGPEFRFRTTLETSGTISPQGKLEGDLVLVGRGDPNLSNRKFPFVKEPETDGPPEKVLAELADQLAARGVKEVTGDVVADDSYFPADRYPSGWEIDDMVWPYGAPISAIAVNDNATTVTLTPGGVAGEPVGASIEPWTQDFVLQNDVATSAAEVKADLALTREPGARLVTVRGTMPAGGATRKLVLAIERPAEHAAALLRHLLEERGVQIGGCVRVSHVPAASSGAATVLGEHLSVPLVDAVRPVNKMSLNLHTEMLLRAAARQKGLWSKPEELADLVMPFFEEAGIGKGDVTFLDGSGLSRHDLVTLRATVRLLQYAKRQPWASVYFDSLPVAGHDGTLADRMKEAPASGRIHAKTGSLEHVAALSGYAETLAGREVIFSIFVNNSAAKNNDAAKVIDQICAAMIEELGGKRRAAKRSR